MNRRFSVPMITDQTRSLYVIACLTKLPRVQPAWATPRKLRRRSSVATVTTHTQNIR